MTVFIKMSPSVGMNSAHSCLPVPLESPKHRYLKKSTKFTLIESKCTCAMTNNWCVISKNLQLKLGPVLSVGSMLSFILQPPALNSGELWRILDLPRGEV